MKKKLFYLFAALLLAGIGVFVSSCERPLAPGQGCSCTYDGQYPEKFMYEWLQEKGYKYCSELQKVLQEKEADHRVSCVPSW